MIEHDPGTEALECTEVVYRALKRPWGPDELVPPEAFIRKIREMSAETGISVSRRKYVTARECRKGLNRMRGSASLHVGKVRDLPLGCDFVPDPIRHANGEVIGPGHSLLMNLPDPVTQADAAEFAASQLVKIARYIHPDYEDQEHRQRRGQQ